MGITLETGSIFPNKQPWISKSLQHVLRQKKLSCYEGEKKKIEAQKPVEREIKQLKSGVKVKQRMSWIKDTQGWLGKEWSPWWGCRTRSKDECDAESAEDLDSFDSSFDIIDFNEELCDCSKGLVALRVPLMRCLCGNLLVGPKREKALVLMLWEGNDWSVLWGTDWEIFTHFPVLLGTTGSSQHMETKVKCPMALSDDGAVAPPPPPLCKGTNCNLKLQMELRLPPLGGSVWWESVSGAGLESETGRCRIWAEMGKSGWH